MNSINIAPVKEFDLNRYLGKWYEIARFDHRFERGLTKVMAEYTQRADGKIEVVNSGFNAAKNAPSRIVGKAKTTSVAGLLRVSFFWIFYSDYRVLALGDDYEWALVGAGNADKYLWILSRTATLPSDTLNAILSEAKSRGFDTDKLIFNAE